MSRRGKLNAALACIAVPGLLGLGLEHAAAQQTANTVDASCPAVTLVTVPWSIVELPGLAPQYLPGSYNLCPGEYDLPLAFRGSDSTRVTFRVVEGQRHVLVAAPDSLQPGIQAAELRLLTATRLYLDEGDASGTVSALERLIAETPLSRTDSLTALMFLNITRSAIGDTAGGRAAMESALQLEQCLLPHSAYLTPYVRGAWGRARPAYCDRTAAEVLSLSAMVPGLGQHRIGHARSGRTHFLRTAIPAVAGSVLLFQAFLYYDEYDAAQTPGAATAAYDRVAWRAWTGGALLATAAVFHALNIRDAIDVGREHEAELAPWIDYVGAAPRVGVRVRVGGQR